MGTRPGEAYGDDDRLPWLETVEEDYREGASIWRILLLIFLVIAVAGAIGFGFWWYQQQQGLSGNGQLIAAQEGDYKVKPDEPGGMQVQGEGSTVFATSEGGAANASVDVGAAPEAPLEGRPAPSASPTGSSVGRGVAVPPSAGELRAREPRAAATATPIRVVPGGAGAVIQLGAFPDEQGASAAWQRLSGRFSYLAPLGRSIERVEREGRTVFRLRVNTGSNGQARDICDRLKLAGERCYVAN